MYLYYIIVVTITILSFVGMIFLTQLSFNTKHSNKNEIKVKNMNNTKLAFAKFTIVLLWIQIGFSLLCSIAYFTRSEYLK
jgi:hypothetical protein